MKKYLFLFFFGFFLCSLFGQESLDRKNRIRPLISGKESYSLIEISAGILEKKFLLNVPKNALGVRVILNESSSNFSLKVENGYQNGVVSGSVKKVSSENWDEEISWSRFDEGFREGNWLITVSASSDPSSLSGEDKNKDSLIAEKQKEGTILDDLGSETDSESKSDSGAEFDTDSDEVSAVPAEGVVPDLSFLIKAEVVRLSRAVPFISGRDVEFSLSPGKLGYALYQIPVKTTQEPIHFKWAVEKGAPLMMLSYGKPVYRKKDADYLLENNEGINEFFLGLDDKSKLKRGVWYLSLLEKSDTLMASGVLSYNFIKKGAVQLAPLKYLPHNEGNALEGCMAATVGITTPFGTSVGAFISAKGDVLCSYSAISDFSGRLATDISLLVSISIDDLPQYLFKAKVVQSDRQRDLALLKIESAAFGKNVPVGFEFPFIEIGNDLQVETGQPLALVGYPVEVTTGKAGTVFALKGIVAGFEKVGVIRHFKSDKVVGGRSSGVVAMNVYYELIGVPSVKTRSGKEITTMMVPVDQMPKSWLSLIK